MTMMNINRESHSRYDDSTPLRCEDCNWRGSAKDCIHTYKPIPASMGYVEPIDKCPKCGNENLIPIEKELIPA